MCQWSKGHSPRMCGRSSSNPSILPEKQHSASFVEQIWVNSNIFTGERQTMAPDFIIPQNWKPNILKGIFKKQESLCGNLNSSKHLRFRGKGLNMSQWFLLFKKKKNRAFGPSFWNTLILKFWLIKNTPKTNKQKGCGPNMKQLWARFKLQYPNLQTFA